ncbi:MAG TPA: GntR family transcriptional regulator [Tepidisphaeraceae bacterium]|nr:GntR family transcriptional regulator [Tepidisphaeraceae bacterium]
MDDQESSATTTAGPATGQKPRAHARQAGLSYKFQRLREKLRTAISTGELSGKLPGERILARKFHANAKTLSKALTDLAAEGLLDRSIGRGTFVKGSEPAAPARGRWLVLCDAGDADSALVAALRESNPDLQAIATIGDIRPSFLNQFSAIIDMAGETPESFLRDLVVRNIPIVAVNREPRTYSMHTVVLDVALGASRLGRDLLLAGHRRLAAVEPRGSTAVVLALHQAIARYAPDATVDACAADEIQTLIDAGITGIVCGACRSAGQVNERIEKAGINIPSQVSLAAVGCTEESAPCSGYYCTAQQVAGAVAGLLRDAAIGRPATLWLTGTWHDLGTTGPAAGAPLHLEDGERARIGGVLV